MKLISYRRNYEERGAILYEDFIYDLRESSLKAALQLPTTMERLLSGGEALMNDAFELFEVIKEKKITPDDKINKVELLAPVPRPTSCRDAYAFRQHVETARRNRGAAMIPEFDQFPVFYFTNHHAVYGPGDIIVEEDHLKKLDFELEAAVVIGKHGKNIHAEKADNFIAGYMIMNDFSARELQMDEMKLNLGPAKGKDFATSFGPFLVTPEELEEYRIESSAGSKYNLEMKAFHNEKQISTGNLKDMNWTFAEIIERASYGVELFPGDIIGSGTVGTGCYLELNGTNTLEAKKRGDEYSPVWLKEGDTIELEITGLGKLKNKIKKADKSYSILAKKKNTNASF